MAGRSASACSPHGKVKCSVSSRQGEVQLRGLQPLRGTRKVKRDCANCNPPHGKVKRPQPLPAWQGAATHEAEIQLRELQRHCADCNRCPHGKSKYRCPACKAARVSQPARKRKRDPEIKPKPEIKPEPEIKQEPEPFTIRGCFGIRD